MRTIIQIGANIGRDDFSRMLCEINEKARVFLIEPNWSLIFLLSTNYSEIAKKHDVTILNIGIVPNPIKEGFLYVDHLETSGCSSILKRKTLPRIHENVKLPFEAKTFDQFCIENNIKEIDLLSIDTEGCDYAIINSINFNKLPIRRVECEVWIHENDDLNNEIPTGPTFFKNVIIPKMNNYEISLKKESDGQDTYVFERNQ